MNADIVKNALDNLNAERRTYLEHQLTLGITAVVIGTGPSFYEWIKWPIVPAMRYGCGVCTAYIPVDVYCLNSGERRGYARLPDTTTVFAMDRCRDLIPGSWLYPQEVPRAEQSGGMAVWLAAMNHRRIGLVGFCEPISPDVDAKFRAILEHWRERGREFVSLMKASAFDDMLETGLR